MKNVKHLKYRMIYNGSMERGELGELAVHSPEIAVRSLAVEKLKASYELQIMALEEKLYAAQNL